MKICQDNVPNLIGGYQFHHILSSHKPLKDTVNIDGHFKFNINTIPSKVAFGSAQDPVFGVVPHFPLGSLSYLQVKLFILCKLEQMKIQVAKYAS